MLVPATSLTCTLPPHFKLSSDFHFSWAVSAYLKDAHVLCCSPLDGRIHYWGRGSCSPCLSFPACVHEFIHCEEPSTCWAWCRVPWEIPRYVSLRSSLQLNRKKTQITQHMCLLCALREGQCLRKWRDSSLWVEPSIHFNTFFMYSATIYWALDICQALGKVIGGHYYIKQAWSFVTQSLQGHTMVLWNKQGQW